MCNTFERQRYTASSSVSGQLLCRAFAKRFALVRRCGKTKENTRPRLNIGEATALQLPYCKLYRHLLLTAGNALPIPGLTAAPARRDG